MRPCVTAQADAVRSVLPALAVPDAVLRGDALGHPELVEWLRSHGLGAANFSTMPAAVLLMERLFRTGAPTAEPAAACEQLGHAAVVEWSGVAPDHACAGGALDSLQGW